MTAPTTPQTTAQTARWYLYLLECRSGALYAGITTDVQRRYAQHLSGKGAKYTRANPPKKLVGVKEYPDRAEASKAEYAIKQLPKHLKINFLINKS